MQLNDAIPASSLARRARCAAIVVALAMFAASCGATPRSRSGTTQAATSTATRTATPWPDAADYTTIRVARAVLLQALFIETSWRRRSYAASLAMGTLTTVRLKPGRCATYTSHLYDELWGLLDAAPGEDWSPLKALVRRDPAPPAVCRPSIPTVARAVA